MPVPAGPGAPARTLLRENVYTSIRDAIVRGELLPGERLRDGELGEWLGVSRTPVREALLRLAEAGLVQARPGKVTLVAPEDPASLAHARTIAAELHALAARLAAPAFAAEAGAPAAAGAPAETSAPAHSHSARDGLDRLRAANESLRAAGAGAAGGSATGGNAAGDGSRQVAAVGTDPETADPEAADPEAAIRADARFHGIVVEYSANPLIDGQLELLVPMLMRAEHLHFDAATVAASADQHDAIIDALWAGDAQRAGELSKQNWLTLG